MRITAFIPARGGSKGIPRKNLALLKGKPLIQYAIESARNSQGITDIFISTDSDEIAQFCEGLGVAVPYRRPAELASDRSSVIDAVLHGLDWKERNDKVLPEAVVLLQPTSPLRNALDLDKAIELFVSSGKDSLISVNKMSEHPYECIRLKESGWNYLAKPAEETRGRQDYKEQFFFINGAIYIAKTAFLRGRKKFVSEGDTELFFMERERGMDIDYPEDLKLTEFYMNLFSEN